MFGSTTRCTEKRQNSTRDVHDAKFNEDKLAIQFKIGRLGCFGLAINWYSNLPFQTWELKPDIKSTVPNTIVFSLSASVVSIELTILSEGIILNSFQHHEQGGEFDWSPSLQGYIISSFFCGYVITQIPIGLMSKKFGALRFLGYGMLVNSVFAFFVPVAADYG